MTHKERAIKNKIERESWAIADQSLDELFPAMVDAPLDIVASIARKLFRYAGHVLNLMDSLSTD